MDINYELYKVFYHVASTLKFLEASKQLFISQSAVSQSIKYWRKTEPDSFHPQHKKVQLTPEGEILLKHVEPAMNLIRQGENQLLDSNGKRRSAPHWRKRYDLPLLSGAILSEFQALPNIPSRLPTVPPSMCAASGQRSGRFYSDELSNSGSVNAEYPCAARIQRYIRRQ